MGSSDLTPYAPQFPYCFGTCVSILYQFKKRTSCSTSVTFYSVTENNLLIKMGHLFKAMANLVTFRQTF